MRNKIYREFYHGIVHIANEGLHIRIPSIITRNMVDIQFQGNLHNYLYNQEILSKWSTSFKCPYHVELMPTVLSIDNTFKYFAFFFFQYHCHVLFLIGLTGVRLMLLVSDSVSDT